MGPIVRPNLHSSSKLQAVSSLQQSCPAIVPPKLGGLPPKTLLPETMPCSVSFPTVVNPSSPFSHQSLLPADRWLCCPGLLFPFGLNKVQGSRKRNTHVATISNCSETCMSRVKKTLHGSRCRRVDVVLCVPEDRREKNVHTNNASKNGHLPVNKLPKELRLLLKQFAIQLGREEGDLQINWH